MPTGILEICFHEAADLNSNTSIVLASFNGANFLSVQLDSLIAQSESQWELLIRDDGSTDDTLNIIKDYQQKDNRIQLLDQTQGVSGSALANFSTLLSDAYEQDAEYVFCCDQDDVWEPDKLQLMLARLKQLEGKYKAPSLLHHDLAVVNETLEPIADSFINMMRLQPSDEHNPQRLITRNEVTGCAMACNRALLEIALPISDQAVMHDWWLALCAGYFGRLAFMPDTLVKYRQHTANTIGAKSFWHGLNPFTNWVAGWRRGDKEFISTVKQASAFKEAMADRLGRDSEEYATLDLYSNLLAATRWQRLKALRSFGLWRNHWLLNIVLVMRMLLLPRTTD
jgi:rhamnosyltransferase